MPNDAPAAPDPDRPAAKSPCVVVTSEEGGTRLQPCRWLGELAEVAAGRSLKGITRAQLVNTQTCRPTREAWVIRSGQHGKKGVHMNFCPICGTDLQPLFARLFADEPGK